MNRFKRPTDFNHEQLSVAGEQVKPFVDPAAPYPRYLDLGDGRVIEMPDPAYLVEDSQKLKRFQVGIHAGDSATSAHVSIHIPSSLKGHVTRLFGGGLPPSTVEIFENPEADFRPDLPA